MGFQDAVWVERIALVSPLSIRVTLEITGICEVVFVCTVMLHEEQFGKMCWIHESQGKHIPTISLLVAVVRWRVWLGFGKWLNSKKAILFYNLLNPVQRQSVEQQSLWATWIFPVFEETLVRRDIRVHLKVNFAARVTTMMSTDSRSGTVSCRCLYDWGIEHGPFRLSRYSSFCGLPVKSGRHLNLTFGPRCSDIQYTFA